MGCLADRQAEPELRVEIIGHTHSLRNLLAHLLEIHRAEDTIAWWHLALCYFLRTGERWGDVIDAWRRQHRSQLACDR